MKLIWFGAENYDWEVNVKVTFQLQKMKCAHTRVYAWTHTDTHTQAHTHIHTRTCTHAHTHTTWTRRGVNRRDMVFKLSVH